LNPLAQAPGNLPFYHPHGAQSGAVGTPGQPDAEAVSECSAPDPAQIDAGLVIVIQAWPHLPEAIRAGILAIVRATRRE